MLRDRRVRARGLPSSEAVTGEGEHRAVVVGVDVQVEQRGAARGGQRVEHGAVAALGHVGDALQHRCRVRRGPGATPVECRRCASDSHSRSTTTRSPGSRRCGGRTVVEYAQAAERAGYDSLWLSDHLFLDVAKYGGPPDRRGVFEPIVALAALAGVVTRPRLGTLVLCEALRPAAGAREGARDPRPHLSAVASTSASARAGTNPTTRRSAWRCRRPASGSARLREATRRPARPARWRTVHVRRALPPRRSAARNDPPALQQPRPPVFVGGKGDRLLALVAEQADGWNTCWIWTPDDYRERLDVLERACDAVGRDPASVWRSLGLYALCGEDERDLERRFGRLQETSPPGVLDGVTLDEWRPGRLVGTVEQVREQVAGWEALGVETLIVGAGAVPFAVTALDDVEMLAEAVRR